LKSREIQDEGEDFDSDFDPEEDENMAAAENARTKLKCQDRTLLMERLRSVDKDYELEEVDDTGHCQFDAIAKQVSVISFSLERAILFLQRPHAPLSLNFCCFEATGPSSEATATTRLRTLEA